MRGPQEPEKLWISDDESTLARFNDEKTWVELELTRVFPGSKFSKIVSIYGIMLGVHSDWVYKRLGGGADGVIEFKLDKTSDPSRNLMRITSMRNVGFDGRWHTLKVAENFEVTLGK